jgi:hypothetical protein
MFGKCKKWSQFVSKIPKKSQFFSKHKNGPTYGSFSTGGNLQVQGLVVTMFAWNLETLVFTMFACYALWPDQYTQVENSPFCIYHLLSGTSLRPM